MIRQIEFRLPSYGRGYHLVTHEIEKQLKDLPITGIVNIVLKHTSAGLSMNENADPSVRLDFESFMNKLIPENDPVFTHLLEGEDDMPAHLKSSLIGTNITVPITNGRLNLGTWQGIYLCEFRNRPHTRSAVVTIIG